MANTWISETESDIEELQITQEDITERTPFRNKLHTVILKVSKKNREGKQELFGLRKGEKNTRKE